MRWSRTKNTQDATEPGHRILGSIPLMSLRQAVVVAEVLNFRHAANVLGVTQSSVSARIKALEDALGILLFERRHRGVRLTDAGQRFVAEVAVGIGHIDLAVQTAGAIYSGVVDPGDCHARRLWEEPFKIVLPIDDAWKATFRLGTP